MTITTRPVGVEELRRAWHAVQDGAYRSTPALRTARQPAGTGLAWDARGPVLPVVAVVPQAGASTIALAAATVRVGRVVECCTATASGLASAATAEMGTGASGWTIGRRDEVHLARTSAIHLCVDDVPPPEDAPDGAGVSVLDIGWNLGQVLSGDGWLTAALSHAPSVLLVTTASVPGLRRLEIAADLLGRDRVVVAARGPQPRRWPRELRSAGGPTVRDVLDSGRWVSVPHDRGLALRGLDCAPLPRPLLVAAEDLWRHCDAIGHRTKEPS